MFCHHLVVHSYDFTCENNCRKCCFVIPCTPLPPQAPQTTGNRHRNCPLQINKRTADNGHTSGYNTARLYTFSCCLYIMSIHQLVTVTALCVIQSRYVTMLCSAAVVVHTVYCNFASSTPHRIEYSLLPFVQQGREHLQVY